MELLVLGSLGFLGYTYLNKEYDQLGIKVDTPSEHQGGGVTLTEHVTKYKNPEPKKKTNMFNFSEMGINYANNKASTLNWTNLNEAYKVL